MQKELVFDWRINLIEILESFIKSSIIQDFFGSCLFCLINNCATGISSSLSYTFQNKHFLSLSSDSKFDFQAICKNKHLQYYFEQYLALFCDFHI